MSTAATVQPQDPPTVMIFRKWRSGDREIFALFPEIDEGRGLCRSYQHIGQHSGADYVGCIYRSRAALPGEYAPLLKELQERGYDNLVIKQRWAPRRGR